MAKKHETFLLINGIDNIVVNKKDYPENTEENAKYWIYVSDIMENWDKYGNYDEKGE